MNATRSMPDCFECAPIWDVISSGKFNELDRIFAFWHLSRACLLDSCTSPMERLLLSCRSSSSRRAMLCKLRGLCEFKHPVLVAKGTGERCTRWVLALSFEIAADAAEDFSDCFSGFFNADITLNDEDDLRCEK